MHAYEKKSPRTFNSQVHIRWRKNMKKDLITIIWKKIFSAKSPGLYFAKKPDIWVSLNDVNMEE